MSKSSPSPMRYAVAAAVHLNNEGEVEFNASVTELCELAKTLGVEIVRTFTQKRGSFDTTAYLGVGKREEMRRYIHGTTADEEGEGVERVAPCQQEIEFIFVDHEISPSQARNLEKEVGCEVLDRTMLILEIFHRHARSRAARAQVEIAQLTYLAPRLRERAKLAGPQGRQRSGVGGRGAGESHMQNDRRKLRERISELEKEIATMDLERATQRARRQETHELPVVALVGYTNAGKSTLMRALTGSDVLVENKLFATLDTTVRALQPETTPRILMTDTVGFIKNLPHGLVASFKSTLQEAMEASLLLHVIDAGDAGFERQLAVTEDVLADIGAQGVPRLLVFNKIDTVGDAQAQEDYATALRARCPGCLVLSAYRPEDVAALRTAIIAQFQQDVIETELLLPWSVQQMRREIFARCEVLSEAADEAGARFRLRGERSVIDALAASLTDTVEE